MQRTGRRRLPPGEHTVAHRLVNGRRMLGPERDQAIERSVSQLLALCECLLQHAE